MGTQMSEGVSFGDTNVSGGTDEDTNVSGGL